MDFQISKVANINYFMFSGFGFKYFNLDGASTHHLINEIAYSYALRRSRKNGFPLIISIDLHSGYYGPDGKWGKQISKVSHHMYNPETDDGEAINSAIESYRFARGHIHKTNRTKLDKKLGQFACARGLHFLVDGLTPAHHIGHYLPEATDYRDWHDPYWDHSKKPSNNILFRSHGKFEATCAKYMFFNTKKITKNYQEIRNSRSLKSYISAGTLKAFLKQKALEIHDTGIYEKFLKGSNIKKEIIQDLMPEILYTVEIYIRSLYSSHENNKKNDKPRIHIPGPTDIGRAMVQALVSKKSKNRSTYRQKHT